MKNKFCRDFLSLTFITLLFLQGIAQQKPLKIGDKIPEKVWSMPLQVLNAPQKIFELAKDRDKLILLDFWNTWCSSCLRNFPKMEELQKHFGSQIKILAVSNENRTVLEKFFSSTNGKRYSKTISLAEDKIFHTLFPHRGVPYIIWIKNGKLLNTTDAEQVTEKAITEIITHAQSSLETVVQAEKSRPLMLSQNFDKEKNAELLGYTFISKGRIRSFSYGTWFHREKGKTYGRQFTNLSLMEIYNAVGDELFTRRGENFSIKRLVNLLKHPEDIDFNTGMDQKETAAKLYNIDYIIPKTQSDSLYTRMLRMINENTEYTALLQKRPTRCLVLKRTSSKDKIATKGGTTIDRFLKTPSVLQNTTFDFLLSSLNAKYDITPLPVVDETDYKGKIDLHFSNINDLKTLQKELLGYDLTLEETDRNLLMLILKDSKIINP
ncbi:redoxin domain-containing protein [Kaistella sp. G5-32]|uniref:Redoxin domain-containing protein n=1 Tax=Kaistella gelatinilytica TaxID=2787636 RepID=A0ABS0FC29_9FLAO|nr:thioredoxin-like domain-containing protein [Kaistella gelatinilytica]MBF8457237.1 redoxin domain-containing protein [Kaistella gelatinilytica]